MNKLRTWFEEKLAPMNFQVRSVSPEIIENEALSREEYAQTVAHVIGSLVIAGPIIPDNEHFKEND